LQRIGAGKLKPQPNGASDGVVWLRPARIRERRSRLPLFVLAGVLLAACLVVLVISRPTGSLQQQAEPARTTVVQPRLQSESRIVPPIIPPTATADAPSSSSLAPSRQVPPAVPLTPSIPSPPPAAEVSASQSRPLPAPMPVQPSAPSRAPPRQLSPQPEPVPQYAADPPAPRAAPAPAIAPQQPARREVSPPPAPGPAAAAPASPDGSYSAFLSAGLPDQATARAQLLDMQRKYAGALGSRRLSYKGVKSGGSLTYRLRVGHLSRADAEALCTRVKAQGGDCDLGSN
jgi:hypothetical protein